MALKPLGFRVLIKPDEPPTESQGGLVLPDDHDHVAMSGTIVAVGKGSKLLWEARQNALKQAWAEVAQTPSGATDEALKAVYKLIGRVEPMPTLAVGDRVAFSAESGAIFTEDGQQYIVMNEDDVVVLVEEESAA